ncbi:hypothetical protein CMEL01_03825 [Colletotrichum melonis]|uniref:Uncharacterized protein n=1 Tax=Colletotrichum melonis TaxID=1209925 RepID=A0AAI9XP61_9PEZI|nr:hypothetical protein CMEL01_03825 [Colletotrichum melonis]
MATLSWDAEGAELRARTIPSLTAPLMVRCTPPPSPAQRRQVLRTYLKEGRYFVIAPDPAFLALGWVTWPFTLGAGPLFTETEYEAAHGGHEKNGIIYLTLAHLGYHSYLTFPRLALLYALGTVGHAPCMHGPCPVASSIKSYSKADALRTQHSDNPLTAPSPSRWVDQLVNWDSAVRSICPDLEAFVTPSCTAI